MDLWCSGGCRGGDASGLGWTTVGLNIHIVQTAEDDGAWPGLAWPGAWCLRLSNCGAVAGVQHMCGNAGRIATGRLPGCAVVALFPRRCRPWPMVMEVVCDARRAVPVAQCGVVWCTD